MLRIPKTIPRGLDDEDDVVAGRRADPDGCRALQSANSSSDANTATPDANAAASADAAARAEGTQDNLGIPDEECFHRRQRRVPSRLAFDCGHLDADHLRRAG